MENLFTHLEQVVLRMDSRFCTEDGHLLKNNVVEAALALDPKLLHYLLADEKLRKQFFRDVDGLLVFDKVQFQRFVMNKQFLPDSYTSFKNKVGLTNENGEFLSESREIVLSWPYKDCMLEGGQTKEDAKRNEIFWNETLAPDEINRLTEPKALCNFRRYDSKGEHETTELLPDDNLIIKGNNLLALYSLRQRFRGKVKLIYIDPPYNTGNDSFGYNDSFNHSTWLTFMKNRLEVAKELLRNDGVLFVQCDDNEQAYLKVLLDQIFGRKNFVACIIPLMNPRGRQESAYPIAKSHEYILCYSRKEDMATFYNFGIKEDNNSEDVYRLLSLRKSGNASRREDRPNMYYPIYYNETSNKISINKSSESDIEIFPIKTDGTEGRWRWQRSNVENNTELLVCKKNSQDEYDIYVKDYLVKEGKTKGQKTQTLIIDSAIINDRAQEHLQQLFGDKVFDYPKSEFLIQRLIEIASAEGDIVLDFHLGSGTTASVAHKMNRRYVGVEQMDYIKDIIAKRLQMVIEGEQGGCSKSVGWNPQNPGLLDGDKYAHNSFIYCELAQANQQLVDEIMAANEPFKLQKVWTLLQEKGFLSYKISPKLINEHAEDFNDLSLEDQKRFLIECLDKNMLYIPYSDIDDEGFTLSENDKQLTRQFYASR